MNKPTKPARRKPKAADPAPKKKQPRTAQVAGPQPGFPIMHNITERKQAEKELRNSEERFRRVFDDGPLGMAVTNKQYHFVQVNAMFCQMLGYTEQELIKLTFKDITHPDDRGDSIKKVQELEKGNISVYKTEKRYITKNKDIIWGSITLSMILDKDEEFQFFLVMIEDITERKRAEQALAESEIKFRWLYEYAPSAYHLLTPDGTLTDINHRWCELLGYRREEVLGRAIFDFVVEEEREAAKASFEEKKQNKEPYVEGSERNFKSKDGALRTFKTHDFFVLDQRQNITSVQTTIEDITERKRAEEALRESEQRLRFHVENSPMAVVEWDTNFMVARWSGGAEKIFGWSRAETIGKPILDLGLIYEEDIPIVQNVMQRLIDGISRHVVSTNRNFTKDGKVIYCEWYNSVLQNPQGKMVSVMSQALDITERKRAEEVLRESEEKYRTILENIEEGYFEVDIAGNFTFFNESVCRLLGYSREEMMGMNNRHYTDKTNAQKLYCAFNQVYRTGIPAQGHDWELIRNDGTKRYVECSVSLRKNKSSQPIGFRGIIRDITERKQAEESLNASEERFAKSFHANPIAICVSAFPDGRMVEVNEAFLRLTGYKREEVIGRSGPELDLWNDPKVRTSIIRELLESGSVRDIEGQLRAKSGHLRDILASAEIIQLSGQPHALIMLSDITERKRAEEALRKKDEHYRNVIESIFRFVPEGLLVLSEDFSPLKQNKAFGELVHQYAAQLGYTEQELAKLITEQVRRKILSEDTTEIQIPKKRL